MLINRMFGPLSKSGLKYGSVVLVAPYDFQNSKQLSRPKAANELLQCLYMHLLSLLGLLYPINSVHNSMTRSRYEQWVRV